MHLDPVILAWLLDPENPSVRYFTLVDLLDYSPEAPVTAQARGAIMVSGDVPKLLEGQSDASFWGSPESYYLPRYTATAWRLMLLAEFGADSADERIRRVVEHLLVRAQLANGGFAAQPVPKRSPEERGSLCFTGNMVWSLIRLGYLGDPRVQQAISWITRYSRFDDGHTTSWPEWLPQEADDGCWGRHTCFRGVIAVLQALAEIPVDKRSPEVQLILAEGAEYLLIHHVYKHSHNLDNAIFAYTRIGFPLFAENDLLRMLVVLARLRVCDPRMQEAVDLLKRKRNKLGQWTQQHEFPKTKHTGFMPVPITPKGEVSQWVTLKALTVLKFMDAL